MRHVLLRYPADPERAAAVAVPADFAAALEQGGWHVEAVFADADAGETTIVARGSGSGLEWPPLADHPVAAALLTPEQPGPAAYPVRRLRPRQGLRNVEGAPWHELIVRPDGRAHLELHVDGSQQLADVEVAHDGDRLLVTVLLGTDPAAPDAGAERGPATAQVALPVGIVDGSRPAHRP